MDRRIGMRGQVDLPVIQHVDGFPHECRVVDLSSRGLVVRRTKSLSERESRLLYRIDLPVGKNRVIRTLARTVWTDGPYQAMRYVGVSQADQLEIAELLDLVHRSGAVLH